MSVLVNPPPQLRIPKQFLVDPETRSFFEKQQTIIFQLWNRTGGSLDSVSGSQNVTLITSDTVLDSAAYGGLYIVDADTIPIQITLPPITSVNSGESIDIAILDATFDTTIIPIGASVTIFGDTSVIMNQQYMSIQYTAITQIAWIAT